MELTDKVILIKEHLDSRGNVYPARKDPYLYGELPVKIRDNPAYVVPVNQVTVKVEAIGARGIEEIVVTGQDPTTTNLIPNYTKETFVVADKVEVPTLNPVTPIASEEVAVPSTPIIPNATPEVELVSQSTLESDIARQQGKATRTRRPVANEVTEV